VKNKHYCGKQGKQILRRLTPPPNARRRKKKKGLTAFKKGTAQKKISRGGEGLEGEEKGL